jgi:DNA repair and recombination protein RAD52
LPPPRPVEPAKSSNAVASASFDGDGEFGSEYRNTGRFPPFLTTIGDLFDEADFAVGTTGNPDEITIEAEAQQQPPTPMNRPQPPRGPPVGRFDNTITPSKPERWNPGNQGARQPLPPNGRPNPSAMPTQGRPMPPNGPPNNVPNSRPGGPPQVRPTPGTNFQNPNGQPPVKTEPTAGLNQDQQPPTGTQSVGFFSARVADMLRDNPNAGPAPGSQFDPHAESPSIRKTAGVDHTKSVPISRPMLSNASPAPNNNSRDFVNPATDFQRRVGAPGGAAGGVGSPLSRGPSTSTFRPLTRTNIDARASPNAAAMNRVNVPPQNMNGKRPPLSDVTNASPGSNPTAAPQAASPTDPKRPRVSDVGQQQPPPPQPQAPK